MRKIGFLLLFFAFVLTARGQKELSLGFDNGHPEGVTHVATSKDGKYVYAIGGKYLKTWEVSTHSVIHSTPVAFDDDYNIMIDVQSNRLFAIIGQRIHILDLSTGLPLDTIKEVAVYNQTPMSLHPKLPVLAFTSGSSTGLFLYDLVLKRVIKTVPDFRSEPPAFLRFLPDGRSILLGTNETVPDKDGKVLPGMTRLYDIENYKYLKTIDTEEKLYSVAKFSPDGKWWLTYSAWRGNLKVRRADGFELYKNIHIDNGFNFAPDSKDLMVFEQNHLVRYSLPDLVAKDTLNYPPHKLSWMQGVVSYTQDGLSAVAGYQTGNDNLLLWDLKGRKGYPFLSALTNSLLVRTSRTGKYFVTVSMDNCLRVWNPTNGDLIYLLRGHKGAIKCFDFNDADTTLVSGDENGNIICWDLNNGQQIYATSEHHSWITSISFGADNHVYLSAGLDNSIRLWDTRQDHSLYTLPQPFGKITEINNTFGIAIFDHHNFIYESGVDHSLNKWFWNGKVLTKIKGTSVYPKTLLSFEFSKDDKYLVASPNDSQSISLIDTSSLTETVMSTWGNRGLNCDRFHDRLVTASFTSPGLSIFDLDTRQQTIFNDRNSHPASADFLPGGGFISTGTDNAISLWSGASTKIIVNTFPFAGTKDFVSVNKDNYYRTTRMGAQAIYFTYQDKKFQFEQFDIVLNRPDLVAAAWPEVDPGTIKLLKTSYERRLQHLGLDSNAIQLKFKDIPGLQIALLPDVQFTAARSVRVRLKSAPGQALLSRIIVWDNNTPIYGTEGISLKVHRNSLDTIITVPLIPGSNQISAEVINDGFTASPIVSATVDCSADFPRSRVFLLTIGINKFKDKALPTLDFAEKDACDFRTGLVSLHRSTGEKDTVFMTMSGPEASDLQTVKNKINSFFSAAGINDKVLVYFSTHGLVSDKPHPGTYLALQHTRVENLPATALSIDSLEDMISAVPCRNKVVFLDACHSGQTPLNVQTAIGNIPQTGNRFKDANNALTTSDDAFSLMESLFMDTKRTGVTIVSASGGLQRAAENPGVKNGAFTGVLLRGLIELSDNNKRSVNVKELMDYIIDELPKTGFKQRPTFRSENLVNDFEL